MRRHAILVVLALSGACSMGRTVVPDAFRRGQTFAIVNVNTSERVMYTRPTVRVSSTGQVDTGSYSVDAGPAAGIFPSTRAAALRAFASSPRYRLLPAEQVLSSPAYAAAPVQTKFFGGANFIPAPGYKLIFDKAAVGRVARGTGATAGVVLNLMHYYKDAGGGRYAAFVTVMVTAIDHGGRIIWTDFASAPSNGTIASESNRIPPAALEGLMAESAAASVRSLIARLDEWLVARR